MQLNHHRLWIFLQVVECGGFSAAANHLYMSQPSVSNQVRQLERSLHATLIDRSGARIRPTAEGEVLVGYAKQMFLLADEAVDAVHQVVTLQTGRLVVGATPDVGTSLLPELLTGFARRHPGIECDTLVAGPADLRRRLHDRALGLALLDGDPPPHPLIATPIDTAHLTHRPDGSRPRPDLRLVHRRDRRLSPAEQAFTAALHPHLT